MRPRRGGRNLSSAQLHQLILAQRKVLQVETHPQLRRGDGTGPLGSSSRVSTWLRSNAATADRRKLTRVLSDPAATVIVVEHRDRLTRFGFEHLQASLAAAGRRVVVLDDAETADELVRDVTEVLTSLCARLYGRRSASRRAAKAVAVATGDGPR